MSRLAPLDVSEITDPELLDLLRQSEELGVPDALFVRAFARSPDQLKPMLDVMLSSLRDGNVDHKLKEIIRIQLARFVEDPYFSALRSKKAIAEGLTEEMIEAGCEDYEDSEIFSEREKVALRFAEQMFLDAQKVDKVFYDEMHKHWSDAEIIEIGSFIALYHGVHMVMKTLDARPLEAA
ncbi:MAG: hypothetical protein JJ899_07880 [Alphaproteobacteria bacterium]|nr:hypothetical protein [Alphaproteobacteria bacterium]